MLVFTVYVYQIPNSHSLMLKTEQFSYRDEDRYCGFLIVVFTVIDHIT